MSLDSVIGSALLDSSGNPITGSSGNIISASSDAFDLETTVISQYANSPNMMTLLSAFSQWFNPAPNIQAFYFLVWNLATAKGFGLDIWGRILRVSRYIQIPNVNQYFGFAGSMGAPFNVAPFYSGGSTSSLYALQDGPYLTLLIAKAFANLCRSVIPVLNQLAQMVFGTGAMCVLDLQDMQMAYVFAAKPTAVNLAIAQNSGVFPNPSGVVLSIRTALLFNAQLLAGTSGSDIGFGSGYGSLTPYIDVNGNTIISLYSTAGGIVLTISSSTAIGSTYFNNITLNGASLAASAATFSSSGDDYTWTWSAESALAFVSGATSTVLIS